MKNNFSKLYFLLIFLPLWACEDNATSPENLQNLDTTNRLSFHFDHSVDGEGVVYNQMIYQNDANNKYSIMTLRYFISDIRLHKYGGSEVKIDTFLYRDIDFPQTRTLVLDSIPNGQYTYISFIFGFDSIKNESYALPPTQEYNNMEWPIPMGGGYHYMKFEGRYQAKDGSIGSFNTHTGRLKTNNGKLNENFIHVRLPNSAFEIADDSWNIQIIMNLNEWYRNPHVYDIEEFGPAIMGNQNAQQMLKENGENAFSVGYMFKES